MKTQDFILKKTVHATCAAEALRLDRRTPVTEVYPRDQDNSTRLDSCIGFNVPIEDGVLYEMRKR